MRALKRVLQITEKKRKVENRRGGEEWQDAFGDSISDMTERENKKRGGERGE